MLCATVLDPIWPESSKVEEGWCEADRGVRRDWEVEGRREGVLTHGREEDRQRR